MSAVPAPLKKNYFLINAPDLSNAQRSKHTPEHSEYNGPLIQNKYIVVGGGILPDGAKTSDAGVLGKIVGSFLVVQADTIEQAWESLKKDPFYASSEVWDHLKITVSPVFVGIPKVE